MRIMIALVFVAMLSLLGRAVGSSLQSLQVENSANVERAIAQQTR